MCTTTAEPLCFEALRARRTFNFFIESERWTRCRNPTSFLTNWSAPGPAPGSGRAVPVRASIVFIASVCAGRPNPEADDFRSAAVSRYRDLGLTVLVWNTHIHIASYFSYS